MNNSNISALLFRTEMLSDCAAHVHSAQHEGDKPPPEYRGVDKSRFFNVACKILPEMRSVLTQRVVATSPRFHSEEYEVGG